MRTESKRIIAFLVALPILGVFLLLSVHSVFRLSSGSRNAREVAGLLVSAGGLLFTAALAIAVFVREKQTFLGIVFQVCFYGGALMAVVATGIATYLRHFAP